MKLCYEQEGRKTVNLQVPNCSTISIGPAPASRSNRSEETQPLQREDTGTLGDTGSEETCEISPAGPTITNEGKEMQEKGLSALLLSLLMLLLGYQSKQWMPGGPGDWLMQVKESAGWSHTLYSDMAWY